MAFCNSCGASLDPGTKFCNKCGAAASAAPAAPAMTPTAATAPPASSGGSSALKIVLIVIGVIVLIGVIGVATVGFIGYRIAKSSHVSNNGENVKVDTPFGNLETSSDPAKISADLGVDIYPGAQIAKGGAATASFGNIHTVSVNFTTTDSLDKVCDFYKQRITNAMVSNADSNHCNFISNDQKNMITVNAQSNGDNVKVVISNVTKTK